MNRKRKRRFSFGELEKEFEAGNESRRLLEDGKDKLSGVDVNCACATNDEFWAIMMLRFGSICANDIVSICTVVPVTCRPWRAEIAKKLQGLLTTSQSALSASLKRGLVDPRASYESVFSRVLDAGRTGNSPFAGCLAPPTAVCYIWTYFRETQLQTIEAYQSPADDTASLATASSSNPNNHILSTFIDKCVDFFKSQPHHLVSANYNSILNNLHSSVLHLSLTKHPCSSISISLWTVFATNKSALQSVSNQH